MAKEQAIKVVALTGDIQCPANEIEGGLNLKLNGKPVGLYRLKILDFEEKWGEYYDIVFYIISDHRPTDEDVTDIATKYQEEFSILDPAWDYEIDPITEVTVL